MEHLYEQPDVIVDDAVVILDAKRHVPVIVENLSSQQIYLKQGQRISRLQNVHAGDNANPTPQLEDKGGNAYT